MTNIIDDDFGTSLWDGDDWSQGLVRGKGNSGALRVGWNMKQGEDGAVVVTVTDGFSNDDLARSFVLLNKEQAVEVLHHLNTLLGNPLSSPATAGGFAPSAD